MDSVLCKWRSACVLALLAGGANGDVLYDRMQLGDIFQGAGGGIVFDDVPIPVSRLPGLPATLDLGRVTYGVRVSQVPAANVEMTAYLLTINSTQAVTSTSALGAVTIPAGTPVGNYSYSFGDGTSTLATATLNYAFDTYRPNYNLADNFGAVFLGLSFNASTTIGPLVSLGPDTSADFYGLTVLGGYGVSFVNDAVPESFAIRVESVVPEPTASAVGLLATMWGLRRRKR